MEANRFSLTKQFFKEAIHTVNSFFDSSTVLKEKREQNMDFSTRTILDAVLPWLV
jgi:hypothetical protein